MSMPSCMRPQRQPNGLVIGADDRPDQARATTARAVLGALASPMLRRCAAAAAACAARICAPSCALDCLQRVDLGGLGLLLRASASESATSFCCFVAASESRALERARRASRAPARRARVITCARAAHLRRAPASSALRARCIGELGVRDLVRRSRWSSRADRASCSRPCRARRRSSAAPNTNSSVDGSPPRRSRRGACRAVRPRCSYWRLQHDRAASDCRREELVQLREALAVQREILLERRRAGARRRRPCASSVRIRAVTPSIWLRSAASLCCCDCELAAGARRSSGRPPCFLAVMSSPSAGAATRSARRRDDAHRRCREAVTTASSPMPASPPGRALSTGSGRRATPARLGRPSAARQVASARARAAAAAPHGPTMRGSRRRRSRRCGGRTRAPSARRARGRAASISSSRCSCGVGRRVDAVVVVARPRGGTAARRGGPRPTAISAPRTSAVMLGRARAARSAAAARARRATARRASRRGRRCRRSRSGSRAASRAP